MPLRWPVCLPHQLPAPPKGRQRLGPVVAALLLAPWVAVPPALSPVGFATAPEAPAAPVATVDSGGEILTMAGDAPAYAEALVVKGGRILQVGPLAEALRIAGPGARRVDLAGRTLLPGFIDAHGHLPDYITTWGRVDGRKAAAASRVAADPLQAHSHLPALP